MDFGNSLLRFNLQNYLKADLKQFSIFHLEYHRTVC